MNKYSSIILTPGKYGEYISDIEQAHLAQIQTSLSFIQKLMEEMDYYLIAKTAIDFFINQAPKLYWKNKDYVLLNYLFSSWLNSFYMWICFHEEHYTEVFHRFKSKYYDDNFEYRAAYNLRTYTTHKALPMLTLSYDIISEKTTMKIKVDDIVTAKKRLQAPFIAELQKLQSSTEYIDAMSLTEKMKEIIISFQHDIWNSLLERVKEALNVIWTVIPKKQPDCYNTILQSKDETEHIAIGVYVSHFLKKASELYPSFLNNED